MMLKKIFLCLFFLSSPAWSADLYIYSASSIAIPLEQLVKNYHPAKVYIVSGASSALAQQIKQGAQADIFISAYAGWIKTVPALETEPLAENQLVLVALKSSGLTSKPLSEFLDDLDKKKEKLALTNIIVPAGLYSKQIFEHYKIWPRALSFAVFGASSQETLSWLVRGDIAAGVIYASDAQLYPRLKIIQRFSDKSHDPIIYQMARLNQSAETKALWRFLKSQTGHLQRLGFRR